MKVVDVLSGGIAAFNVPVISRAVLNWTISTYEKNYSLEGRLFSLIPILTVQLCWFEGLNGDDRKAIMTLRNFVQVLDAKPSVDEPMPVVCSALDVSSLLNDRVVTQDRLRIRSMYSRVGGSKRNYKVI